MINISFWGLFSLIIVFSVALAIGVVVVGIAVSFIRHIQPQRKADLDTFISVLEKLRNDD